MTDVIIRMYFKDIRKAIKIIGLFIFEADPSFAYHSPEHLTNSLHKTFMAPKSPSNVLTQYTKLTTN